jgi:hypothetical protein
MLKLSNNSDFCDATLYYYCFPPFRYVESDRELAIMSVCCAVLTFCSILWRRLFAFLTNMHMSWSASFSLLENPFLLPNTESRHFFACEFRIVSIFIK